ncbi:MAG: polymer-forming cytoskeletal protein [Phycisphaerae bacterium]
MKSGANTRIVRCCNCGGMMRVAARALSVFCPHCHKRITLENLRIIGSHPGKTLATCGDILVEPSTTLNLEITANNVIVRGRVRGSIRANASVEVTPTGRVVGDVKAPKIIVREGGVIQGRCEMTAPLEQLTGSAPAGDDDQPIPNRMDADPHTPPSTPPSPTDQEDVRKNPTTSAPRQIRPIQLG